VGVGREPRRDDVPEQQENEAHQREVPEEDGDRAEARNGLGGERHGAKLRFAARLCNDALRFRRRFQDASGSPALRKVPRDVE
jgi:hypothetical protein